jgi:DNA-directed RNA polymerase beta subunit
VYLLRQGLNYIVQIQSTKILKLLFKMFTRNDSVHDAVKHGYVNGAERVVVSHYTSSPGSFLDHSMQMVPPASSEALLFSKVLDEF